MKAKLTAGVRALANGAATDNDRPVLTGVYMTENEAVVADGHMIVVKRLQPQEMPLEPVMDDGIRSVIVPSDALKACEGEIINLQTIEAMRVIPESKLLDPNATRTATKVVVRMDGAGFSVEADAIEGSYPSHRELFASSPFVGQVAVSTKVIKKLLRTLPNDSMMRFRISEPDKPVEFQCIDPDGDVPIKGIFMPMHISWENTKWETREDGDEV